MLKTAVIIPVWNRPQIICEALDCVRLQTRQPDKVIIVDDGSTDNTAEAVRTWLEQHARGEHWALVSQPNAGVSAARNNGATIAGEVDAIAFLDSDDLWPKDFLERTSTLMGSDTNLVAICCDALNRTIDANGHITDERLRSHRTLAGQEPGRLLGKAFPGTPSTLFRKSVFDKVGGFSTKMRYSEDALFFRQCSMHGGWGHAQGEPVVYRTFKRTGSAPHLSQLKHTLSRLRYARYLEVYLRNGPNSWWNYHSRHAVAQGWYKAARDLHKQGHPKRARALYRKAWSLWTYNLNYARRALLT